MSMVKPSIDYLAGKVDSKYTLVIMASKRARELIAGAMPLVDANSTSPVSIALEEVGQGELYYERK